jgi:uncharacterized protein (DUF4415 family)
MRDHYGSSKAKRDPYARRLRQQVTIRLDHDTVKYFKRLAEETGIGYQTLINLYLRECVATGKKLSNTWAAAQASG